MTGYKGVIMSDFTENVFNDLEQIKNYLPIETETMFGKEINYKKYESSLNEAKHCARWFFADSKNEFSNQISGEIEHLEYLKEYIENLDENINLQKALIMAVDGYAGALKILQYYKIKEEIDG